MKFIANKVAKPVSKNHFKDYEQQIAENRRWNFIVNVGDLTCFNLAMSFVFATTILPLYASYLTSAAVLIGLIPAIQEVASYFPQIIMAHRSEKLPRKKPFIVKISVMERLPYLFVALGIFFWPQAPNWFSYALLALSLAVARASGGLGAPAWQAMLGKVIHPDRKGMLFGMGLAFGSTLGIAGAWLSRHVLSTYPNPTSFGICFLLTFGAQALSWTFLALNREPERKPTEHSTSITEYFKQLPSVLHRNLNFRRFLLSQALLILGGMGVSFYIVYARRVFLISDSFAATVTMAALISQAAGALFLGRLSDLLGHKWINQLGAILGAAAAAFMLFIPNPNWLFPVFILMNLSLAALRISRMSITMEFGNLDKLPTFVALFNTLLAVPMLLAPVAGGWIIDVFGYRWLFILGITFYLIGWFMLWKGVRDPRMQRRSSTP